MGAVEYRTDVSHEEPISLYSESIGEYGVFVSYVQNVQKFSCTGLEEVAAKNV
jgi:hypothetical protein